MKKDFEGHPPTVVPAVIASEAIQAALMNDMDAAIPKSLGDGVFGALDTQSAYVAGNMRKR
jgi:hypothetical protein